MGYELAKPGDLVQELLAAANGNDQCLKYNIKRSPEHWCCAIALAVPFFMLVRTKKYCKANQIDDELFCFIPAD